MTLGERVGCLRFSRDSVVEEAHALLTVLFEVASAHGIAPTDDPADALRALGARIAATPVVPARDAHTRWLDGLHPNARAALSEHDRSALLALAGA